MTRTSLSNPIRLSIGLLAVCCCAAAFAQPSATTQQKPGLLWIGDLDSNHDGRISPQEAATAPAIAKSFAILDLSHDGYLDMSEIQAYWQQLVIQNARASEPGRMAAFDKADKNRDGKLTPEEAKAGMPRVAANFATLDTNKDGTLSKTEVAAGAQLVAQRVLAGRRQRNAAAFARADSNHDGKLSRTEFGTAFPRLLPSFPFFDENHDGFVSAVEFALPPG